MNDPVVLAKDFEDSCLLIGQICEHATICNISIQNIKACDNARSCLQCSCVDNITLHIQGKTAPSHHHEFFEILR